MAWAGGKIVTNDKDAVLRKFLLRKQAAGEKLTPDQLRALGDSAHGGCTATRCWSRS